MCEIKECVVNISAKDFKEICNLHRTVIEKVALTTETVQRHGIPFQRKVFNLYVRPELWWMHRCPHCMETRGVYDHQSGEVTWRAPSMNGVIVYLKYAPARIYCPQCGAIVREYIPWADGNSRFTIDFNNDVAWMTLHVPKTAVQIYYDISWQTVGNCLATAHKRLEPDLSARLQGLRKICVDETSYSKGHKYITVVYDMERFQVVWVHLDHGHDVFAEFAQLLTKEQREAIEVVAGDGARWIDSVTAEYFPNAARCIDLFHLVGWANEAVDEVRKEAVKEAKQEYVKAENALVEAYILSSQALLEAKEQLYNNISTMSQKEIETLVDYISLLEELQNHDGKDLTKSKTKKLINKALKCLPAEKQEALLKLKKLSGELKNARYAVTKNPENRTACQNDKLNLIAASAPSLYKAYELKESLRQIAHMRVVDGAEHEIDLWIERALESRLPAFVTLAEKISRHKPNLLNSIRFGANSSQSESCNALIKSLINIARGFRNIDNLTALIFLKCSRITVPLRNRHQYTAEQKDELRRKAKEYRQKREAAKREQILASTAT